MRLFVMTMLLVFPFASAATERSEEEILLIVQEHSPEQVRHLQRLKELDASRYARALHQINHRLDRREARQSQRRLELMTLRAEFNALAEAATTSDAAELEEIRAEMIAVANQHFDLKTQAQQESVQNLEQRIAELERQIAERNARRDELIDEQVAQALGEE